MKVGLTKTASAVDIQLSAAVWTVFTVHLT